MIMAELGDLEQVVHAACMVESAIRGEPVSRHDARVQVRVQVRAANIILAGVGAQMRAVAERDNNGREDLCLDS